MTKTVCKAKRTGKVPNRGNPSVEWYKNGKPQYYCCGWENSMTDELLEVCQNCRDNINYAQNDLEKWNEKSSERKAMNLRKGEKRCLILQK